MFHADYNSPSDGYELIEKVINYKKIYYNRL